MRNAKKHYNVAGIYWRSVAFGIASILWMPLGGAAMARDLLNGRLPEARIRCLVAEQVPL